MCAKSFQLCLTLCDPMDCSPPGSSVHGILQARILKWACHALLQGIFPTQKSNLHFLRLLHWQAGSLPLAPPEKPNLATYKVANGEGNGTPLQYSCLENPMDWGALVGCSPWGREELDTTEQLPFHFSLSCIGEGNGNPLQCSCLENPRDRGAWWAAVYGVAQSRHDWSDLASKQK